MDTRKSHQRVEPMRTPRMRVKSSILLVALTSRADIMPMKERIVMGLVRVRKKVVVKVLVIFFL